MMLYIYGAHRELRIRSGIELVSAGKKLTGTRKRRAPQSKNGKKFLRQGNAAGQKGVMLCKNSTEAVGVV